MKSECIIVSGALANPDLQAAARDVAPVRSPRLLWLCRGGGTRATHRNLLRRSRLEQAASERTRPARPNDGGASVVGVLAGLLMLGERPDWSELAALVLILFAIGATLLPSRRSVA